jgi:hypothetical protein
MKMPKHMTGRNSTESEVLVRIKPIKILAEKNVAAWK